MNPGDRVGRWELVHPLGKGGMGTVWEARDPALPGRRVALKLLLPGLATPELIHRFLREAQLLARVNHPGVVKVHEVGADPRGPFLVTDLVEGQSLAEAIEAGGLPPARAVEVVAALCEAVGAIHAAGLVHRDVKPGNVHLTPAGSPFLLDFGLARELDGEGLTRTGELLGTPVYMAPEQARDPRGVDPRADVYSLGAVLYALLAGREPFSGGLHQVLMRVLLEGPAWPCTPDRRLDAVVRRAMARDREERYASSEALRQALTAALRPPPRSLRRALAAGALAIAGGSLAWSLSSREQDRGASQGPAPSSTAQPASRGAVDSGPVRGPRWNLVAGQRLSSTLHIEAVQSARGSPVLSYELELGLAEQVRRADDQGLERVLSIERLDITSLGNLISSDVEGSPLEALRGCRIRVLQAPDTGALRALSGLKEAVSAAEERVESLVPKQLLFLPLQEQVMRSNLELVWGGLPEGGIPTDEPWVLPRSVYHWGFEEVDLRCDHMWEGEQVRFEGTSAQERTRDGRVLRDVRLAGGQRWREWGVDEGEFELDCEELVEGNLSQITIRYEYRASLQRD